MTIQERVASIQTSLVEASEKWGRAPQLIAVSKTVPAERVNELTDCGIFHIGENRVQEILAKLPNLDARFEIDLIGQLQINKVKSIIDKVSMIQSLDRMPLAQEIDRRAQQRQLRMPVLVEVNIGGESQKAGIAPETCIEFIRQVSALPGLEVRGLMSVMPNLGDEAALTPYFSSMRRLFEQARDEGIANTRIEVLSMGMSGDYLIAAREGATHVRIGSAIFGARG